MKAKKEKSGKAKKNGHVPFLSRQSVRAIVGTVGFLATWQIIFNVVDTDFFRWNSLIFATSTSMLAVFWSLYAYYEFEAIALDTRRKFLGELGLTEADIILLKDNVIPLIRKVKDIDFERASQIIERGVRWVNDGEEWDIKDEQKE